MKKILLVLLASTTFVSCENEPVGSNYSIEGKWVVEGDNPNTMYIYSNGVRYTYYCVYDDCKEYFRQECEAGDSNAIPGTNNYWYNSLNNTLTVDLGGNNLVTTIIYSCNGGIVTFETPGYSLYKLGTDCQ